MKMSSLRLEKCIYLNSRNYIKLYKRGTFKRQIHSGTLLKQINPCPDGKAILMDPACKVALVTGGTTGIGFAAAAELLATGAQNIAITGLDTCRGKDAVNILNNAYGRNKAMFINANVNCMSQFQETFVTVMEAYKRIDIVINAAGICNGSQWEREIVTNVVGTIRGTLLAYQYVGKEGYGKGGMVINIAGIGAFDSLPPAPTLCASQAAIVGLCRSFGDHSHYKRTGIRIVALCPGFTQTDFIRKISDRGMTDAMGDDLNKMVNKAKKQKPEACGKAIVHLLKHGRTGSVWTIEGSRLFSIDVPNRGSYSTLVAQYM